MKVFERIYHVVEKIPKGKVMTYGQIASHTDTTPRVVGFALHFNKNPKEIPCHRVVKQDGKLAQGYAFGGIKKQKEKLEAEGIVFDENKIRGFNGTRCRSPRPMRHRKAPAISSDADVWQTKLFPGILRIWQQMI